MKREEKKNSKTNISSKKKKQRTFKGQNGELIKINGGNILEAAADINTIFPHNDMRPVSKRHRNLQTENQVVLRKVYVNRAFPGDGFLNFC